MGHMLLQVYPLEFKEDFEVERVTQLIMCYLLFLSTSSFHICLLVGKDRHMILVFLKMLLQDQGVYKYLAVLVLIYVSRIIMQNIVRLGKSNFFFNFRQVLSCRCWIWHSQRVHSSLFWSSISPKGVWWQSPSKWKRAFQSSSLLIANNHRTRLW